MKPITAIQPPAGDHHQPVDYLVLAHDERRVRRKVLRAKNGTEVLLDLPQTTTLEPGQLLEFAPAQFVEVVAADELLYEIRAEDAGHLLRLAWHIGNRHTPAQLDPERILIKRDHVLKTMLEGLGATVINVSEPFFAEHGAYHSHSHGDAGHALFNRK